MTACDNCFIDTNILLYSIGEDIKKQAIAEQLIRSPNVVISTQVLNEFCNVVFRKQILSFDELLSSVKFFDKYLMVIEISSDLVVKALTIKNRYHYSYWDSLIIATALKAQTTILYSEDMQHGQMIDNQLTIINPFLS